MVLKAAEDHLYRQPVVIPAVMMIAASGRKLTYRRLVGR